MKNLNPRIYMDKCFISITDYSISMDLSKPNWLQQVVVILLPLHMFSSRHQYCLHDSHDYPLNMPSFLMPTLYYWDQILRSICH